MPQLDGRLMSKGRRFFLTNAICCVGCLGRKDQIDSTKATNKSFGRERQRRCTGTSSFQRWYQQTPLVKTTSKPVRESLSESEHLIGQAFVNGGISKPHLSNS